MESGREHVSLQNSLVHKLSSNINTNKIKRSEMWWCPFSSNSQPMASSFPSPLLNLPLSSSSLSNSTAVGAITTGVCWRSGGRRSRGRTVIANATEKEEQGKDSPAFNPFGFVTDNPSSRSAIQLPESPAEDGNVGQMLYVRPLYFL